jgi:mannose/fructose/N-acetylgalactosamine-specific phosphotransferase system component IIC
MRRRFSRFIGASLILGGLLLAFPLTTLAADAPQKITVSVFQAVLIALGYYLSQGPWLFGFGFFTIYRPLAAGLIVGLILGDPGKGTLIGAAINLIYLGFISAGGSIPGDPALAGWVGTTLALASNLDYAQALAIAVPIGLLGTIIWNFRMTGDVVFLHYADRKAEEANIGEVARANWLYPQIWLFIITFVPVFLFASQGLDYVTSILTSLPTWVLNGLAIAGGLLPAIGIAMNMRFIFRGAVIPYFFLGYTLVVASNHTISIVIIGVIGLVLAYLHMYFVGTRGPGATMAASTATAAAAPQAGT